MSLAAVQSPDPARANERMMPNDPLAEQSTLGGMMLSQDAAAEVVEVVRGRDFYSPRHEVIFNAISALFNSSVPTDVIAVTDKLTKDGNLVRAGGAEYLHSLTSAVPTAANASYYAEIVAEKAVLRRMIEAGTKIAQMGYENTGEVTELVNTAQQLVFSATEAVTSDVVNISEALKEATEEMEAIQKGGLNAAGVLSGFVELDEFTHGFHPGQLIIIAARPAVGKSTFALDVARNAAVHQKKPVMFISLEMGRTEIAMRLLAAESQVFLQSMRKGKLEQNDWNRIAQVQGSIGNAPLFIDDSPNMTMGEIRAKARRQAQQGGLSMIVLDYMQLLSSGKKVESRQQEVSEFSRSLKLLAKELKIPVVALSQLNRNSEQTKDKKPEISQLRESGSLEQDADVVILLHREALYEKEHPRAGEADIILAKQRNGPTGTVVVAFQGHYSRFANMKK